MRKHHFNLRSTDDQFTLVIECTEKTNEAQVTAFLQSVGATGINTQTAETGWWLGTYDKEVKSFEHQGTALV